MEVFFNLLKYLLTSMDKVSYAVLDLFLRVAARLHVHFGHIYIFRAAPRHRHLE